MHFAELRYGVGLEELVQAGAAKATFDRLVATCLEVPFEQNFDGHVTSKVNVSSLEDNAHSAAGDLAVELISPRIAHGDG